MGRGTCLRELVGNVLVLLSRHKERPHLPLHKKVPQEGRAGGQAADGQQAGGLHVHLQRPRICHISDMGTGKQSKTADLSPANGKASMAECQGKRLLVARLLMDSRLHVHPWRGCQCVKGPEMQKSRHARTARLFWSRVSKLMRLALSELVFPGTCTDAQCRAQRGADLVKGCRKVVCECAPSACCSKGICIRHSGEAPLRLLPAMCLPSLRIRLQCMLGSTGICTAACEDCRSFLSNALPVYWFLLPKVMASVTLA